MKAERSKEKSIRDPLYDYITLDSTLMPLVNSPEFQRLRRIRQTGYEALFPSALHNRFVHSLGVYHLGRKAIHHFQNNISEIPQLKTWPKKKWDSITFTFIVACLLHDVGHSPFSHTGEEFYNKGINFAEALFHALVTSNVGQALSKPRVFKNDLSQSTAGTGKPHEAMSALIGLELCDKYNISIIPDLFTRCIIGLHYYSAENDSTFDILNAIISLLNGDLIDVDKLDYIIRDAYVTGYKSMSIDLERLLSGVTLYQKSGRYLPCFKKGTLSVIENVIYANDLERRWIQLHPTVLYENMLITELLEQYDNHVRKMYERVPTSFTRGSLSVDGDPTLSHSIRLMSDDDILTFIKHSLSNETAKQYLDRNLRLKPFWKSEASYTNLSEELPSKLLPRIIHDFKMVQDMLRTCGQLFICSDSGPLLNALSSDTNPHSSYSILQITRAQHVLSLFESFYKECNLKDHVFAIVIRDRFRSSYRKIDQSAIWIELNDQYVPLENIISLKSKELLSHYDDAFFYVYTTQRNLDALKNPGRTLFDYIRRNFRTDI